MSALFPPIKPNNQSHLQVSDIHSIHYECAGNPDGRPVVLLHGGPGGGLRPEYRRYFDPKYWHIIQFSQRGCGESTPFAELNQNTTWDLIDDIEKLRKHLSIKSWCVFGGSWGSTLALKYAQCHAAQVEALFLRGIFLLRDREINWFYQEGASRIFPDLWEAYLAPIPIEEQKDLVAAYYKRLISDDEKTRITAARAWSKWEGGTSKLIIDKKNIDDYGDAKYAEAFARIECHYFINKGFMGAEEQILDHMQKIEHIPGCIVQGRYDVVCPAESAWELHKQWPNSELIIVPSAGHSVSEEGISLELVEYIKRFSKV